ncbi:hypothetical protein JCM15765_20080 [Paradesulfitobacterium aromaticivorans]
MTEVANSYTVRSDTNYMFRTFLHTRLAIGTHALIIHKVPVLVSNGLRGAYTNAGQTQITN